MTTLPFVAQYPISTATFVHTLQPNIGRKTKKGKFAPPSTGISANINSFIHALVAYEKNPNDTNMALLNKLVAALNLSPIRLQEDNNSVIFIPSQADTPIKCGGVLTWNFNTDLQFFVFDPHPGQDGTIFSVTSQYLAGAKCLLSHYFNPNVDDNPNFKGNPIGPNNIKRFADPAHSNTTAFVPFCQALFEVFPQGTCTVSHGMVGKPNFQMIANNDFKAQFLSDGTRSFDALLAIALALQPLPTNPNMLTICGSVPGFITSTAKVKAPLCSVNNRNAPLRVNTHIGDNTDSVGHYGNGGSAFNLGHQTDRTWFVEFGGHMRKNGNHLMAMFCKAQALATRWYLEYDATIQDPWQLKTRFPNVYNDMSLYPKLFEADFVAAYKAKGTNPYNNQAAMADIVSTDVAIPEDLGGDISDNDLVDPDAVDDGDTSTTDSTTAVLTPPTSTLVKAASAPVVLSTSPTVAVTSAPVTVDTTKKK